jgi:hypothetical protein
MSQPCHPDDVNAASTLYEPVLMVPAGQVVVQRTVRRIRPVASDIEKISSRKLI